MASIERRDGSKGTAFRVKWRDRTGRQRSRTFPDLVEAQTYMASLAMATEERPRSLARSLPSAITLDSWFRDLTAALDRKPTTLAGYSSLYHCWIRAPLGATPLDAIRPMDIQRLLASMDRSGARKRQVYALLHMVLAQAVANDLLDTNPAHKVSPPRVAQREQLFLTPQQLHDLACACGHYGLLVTFLAYSGLRWGEAMGLEGDDISPRAVTVRRSITEIGGKPVLGTPKSHQRRTIGLPLFLTEQLLEEGPVFRNHLGGRIRHGNFTHRVFKPAASSMGLRNLQIHDLRHTCAAWLVSAGVHAKAIQVHLGQQLPGLRAASADLLVRRHQPGERAWCGSSQHAAR